MTVLDPVNALAQGLAAHPEDGLVVLRAVRDHDGDVTDFRYVYANEAASRIAGRPLLGKRLEPALPAAHRANTMSALGSLLHTSEPVLCETTMHHPDHPGLHGRCLSVYALAVDSEQLVCQFRDVTSTRRVQQSLQHEALHDPLTGLPNRRLFSDLLHHALGSLTRRPGHLALLFCDLDHFKLVNDTSGHAVGDRLLVQAARRLEGAVRETDVVGRFGGDEFVVLCEDLDGDDVAQALAARVRDAVTGTYTIEDVEAFVGVSVGIATTTESVTVDQLVSEADAALYEAKRTGRQQYVLFNARMREVVHRRFDTEAGLRRGLRNREFELHYQPQIDLTTGELYGAEALLRWQDPYRGLLLPGQFLDVCEETGLIVEIGARVLESACTEAKRWSALTDAPPTVQVNLSARQLAHPALLDHVTSALESSGLDPERLELEVTESQVLGDLDSAADSLHRLRALGLTLALDDFGTGYSSLSWLQQFPVSTLKLDRSFVRNLETRPQDVAIVSAVIDLAHALQLRVVAEGVETEVQRQILTDLAADQAQGFHLARPMPPDQFHEQIRADAAVRQQSRRTRGCTIVLPRETAL